jgi:hypothetical protein
MADVSSTPVKKALPFLPDVGIPNGATVNQELFPGGCEILLLNGTVTLNQKELDQHTWIRMPADEQFSITGQHSARFYVKYGHLLTQVSDIE